VLESDQMDAERPRRRILFERLGITPPSEKMPMTAHLIPDDAPDIKNVRRVIKTKKGLRTTTRQYGVAEDPGPKIKNPIKIRARQEHIFCLADLSLRDRMVLGLLAKGYSDKYITLHLKMTKSNLSRVLHKVFTRIGGHDVERHNVRMVCTLWYLQQIGKIPMDWS
jgi:hypothetical protein